MPKDVAPPDSARRDELLELAYRYVLDHGIAGLSLRPLAAAVGSSPRVLLFLFGSKDGLVRALLARARADELELLDRMRVTGPDVGSPRSSTPSGAGWPPPGTARSCACGSEGYARSLVDPAGPWAGFAAATVEDWLALLASAQPPARPRQRGRRGRAHARARRPARSDARPARHRRRRPRRRRDRSSPTLRAVMTVSRR